MSIHETEVQCPVCEGDFEVSVEWTPPEHGYGADADGNRGITLPGYFEALDAPEVCPCCGVVFTGAQRKALEEDAERHANESAQDHFEYDGPDTLEELD